MASTKQIIKEGIYFTIGSVIAFALSYLFRIVLAHNLSVEEYGLFYSIWNFLTFFLFFLYLGLDQASIHYVVKYKVEEKFSHLKSVLVYTLAFQLLTTLIFVVLIFNFSNFLELNYFRYENSGYFLKLMSFYLLFNVLGGITTVIIYGFQKIKIYTWYTILQSFFYLFFAFIGFRLNLGLYSPFLAYLATSVILLFIFFPISLKIFPLFHWKSAEVKNVTCQLFSYGLPVMLVAISSRLIIQTDTLMLTRMTSLTEVGLYQAALPIATIFNFFSAGILTILFPLFTELWHRQEKSRIESYLRAIYKYLFLLLLPLVLLTLIFSEHILTLMFGAEYLPAKGALIILLLSVLFNIFSSINFQCFSAFGNPKLISKIVLFGAMFNIIFNFILIPFWGIEGAAISTSLTYLLMFIFSKGYMKRYIPLKLEIKTFSFLTLFILISGIILWLLRAEIEILTLGSFLFLMIYIYLILTLKIIDRKELKELFWSLFRKETIK